MNQEEKDRIAQENGYIDDNQYQRATNSMFERMYQGSRSVTGGSWSIEGCLIGLLMIIMIPVLIIWAVLYFVSIVWPYLVLIGIAYALLIVYKRLPDEKKAELKRYAVENKPKTAGIVCAVIVASGVFLHFTTNDAPSDKPAPGYSAAQNLGKEKGNGSDIHQKQPTSDITILGLKEAHILYPSPNKAATVDLEVQDGNKIKATVKNHELEFTDLAGSKVYYRCTADISGRGTNECLPFTVSEIPLSGTDLRMWSITAKTGGTSPANLGYWLLGFTKDGNVKEYLSPAILAQQGMPLVRGSGKGHYVKIKYENERLIFRYQHEEWPDGVPHTHAKHVIDKEGQLKWDDEKQTFVVL